MNKNGRKSPPIKISSEWEKKLITMFISMMGVQPIDLFETEDKASLLVRKEDFYKVKQVGLHKLKSISERVGKNIEIVVFSDDIEECVENLFRPAEINGIKKENKREETTLKVYVPPWDKGKALGRKSYKLHRAKTFLKRHFNINNVRIV